MIYLFERKVLFPNPYAILPNSFFDNYSFKFLVRTFWRICFSYWESKEFTRIHVHTLTCEAKELVVQKSRLTSAQYLSFENMYHCIYWFTNSIYYFFYTSNTIYGPITIIYLSSVLIHIHIICVPKCLKIKDITTYVLF
jgi:hypothetical protein